MARCSGCGGALADGASICENCGLKFSTDSADSGFGSIVSRFWGFDRMVGSVLIKFGYYIGMAFIAFGTLAAAFTPSGGLLGGGVGRFIIAFAVGFLALLFWRVLCELFIIAFQIFNRLGEIRDRLPIK